MKTLEELIKEIDETIFWQYDYYLSKSEPKTFAKMVALEFGRIILEEAADNVILSINGISEKSNGNFYLVDSGNHYSETDINVDKDSITSVLNKYL